jgi:hypothetical protein
MPYLLAATRRRSFGIRQWVVSGLLLGVVGESARGHFVWIEADQQGGKVDIRSAFGEHGQWDPAYADQVKQTKYQIQRTDGPVEPVPMAWDATHQWLAGEQSAEGAGAIRGECVWGLFGKSADSQALLTFHPKAMFGPAQGWKKVPSLPSSAIEVVATPTDRGIELLVLAHGKPLADAKLKLFPPGATSSQPAVTDATGKYVWGVADRGRYAVAVVHRTPTSGTWEGKAYQGLMDVATLTFEYATESAKAE